TTSVRPKAVFGVSRRCHSPGKVRCRITLRRSAQAVRAAQPALLTSFPTVDAQPLVKRDLCIGSVCGGPTCIDWYSHCAQTGCSRQISRVDNTVILFRHGSRECPSKNTPAFAPSTALTPAA